MKNTLDDDVESGEESEASENSSSHHSLEAEHTGKTFNITEWLIYIIEGVPASQSTGPCCIVRHNYNVSLVSICS